MSSTEGVGTEIRITFEAGVPEDTQPPEIEKLELQGKRPTVSLIGFDDGSRGTNLLREVLENYLQTWWGLQIVPASGDTLGDILVLNEDTRLITQASAAKDISRPFVLLTSSRADAETMATVTAFDRLGGFCRLVSKPTGPSRLRQVLKACVHYLRFRESSRSDAPSDSRRSDTLPSALQNDSVHGQPGMFRHASQDNNEKLMSRPRMMPRAYTFHPTLPEQISTNATPSSTPPQEYPSSPGDTTINVGAGGTLLKSSIGTWDKPSSGRARVLVVEDNQILRDLL